MMNPVNSTDKHACRISRPVLAIAGRWRASKAVRANQAGRPNDRRVSSCASRRPVHAGGRGAVRRQRSGSRVFSGISPAAANGLLAFPSMRQIQSPRRRSRRSRSRAPARSSQPPHQRPRPKLCGSYWPKLWFGPTGQLLLFRRSCCFLTERAPGMLTHPPHRREVDHTRVGTGETPAVPWYSEPRQWPYSATYGKRPSCHRLMRPTRPT